MIRVIYTWRVAEARMDEFNATWRATTRSIHNSTEGARGSFCVRSIDNPGEVLTIALWETEAQWRDFMANAKSHSMRSLHEIAEQVSARVYAQLGDETVAAT